jgi:ribonuclease BN (tRNA processing enzyme)
MLRVAFVTHLHSDHTVGYPDLILSPWTIGRRVPITVYGPRGLKAMTEHLRKPTGSTSTHGPALTVNSETFRMATK